MLLEVIYFGLSCQEMCSILPEETCLALLQQRLFDVVATYWHVFSFDSCRTMQAEHSVYITMQAEHSVYITMQAEHSVYITMQAEHSVYITVQAEHSVYITVQAEHSVYITVQAEHSVYITVQAEHSAYITVQAEYSVYQGGCEVGWWRFGALHIGQSRTVERPPFSLCGGGGWSLGRRLTTNLEWTRGIRLFN